VIQRRGLAPLALCLWVAAACSPAVARGPDGEGRALCAAVAGVGDTSADARPRGGEVVVPLVIHAMTPDVPPPNPHWPSDPLAVWDAATIAEYFGGQGRAGRVNGQVWMRVGMRVAVVRVERCQYSPARWRMDADGKTKVSVPSPEEGLAAGTLYDRINTAFNAYDARDNRALDVYVWVKVGEARSSSAYGTSLKRPTAAVWVDAFCAIRDDPGSPVRLQAMEPETCARKIAHEIAHALTLPHVCKRAGLGPDHPDAQIPVECSSPAETAESRRNLMRAVNQGDELSADQASAARAWAQQHYGSDGR